ncbi:hypothetical protein C5F49_02540 [Nitrosopumilus oxyclinae]|uniref:DUF4037 domain-containing protein n=1 Tax=Nitrosopumilus oxyclinae TaxID=1959104 RepID=A0A7D5R2L4_9ARCH|nr:hypothetical protein [Nitrosopumilus oxyclinae]QLH04318.1 hypothetical protein C5F49_02540 [Nitrosopumilus oxyclinae]
MEIQKFIKENQLSGGPIGLGGCRISELSFDSCDYDLFIFDGKSEPAKIVKAGDDFVTIHHTSLSETNSEKLLQYHKLEILQDESWDLRMFLSKIEEKHTSLYSDFAKNCLIESQFCSQKAMESIQSLDVFAPCWQKCATYYLAKAISSINNLRPSPSHMLDSLRKLKKNTINEHISIVMQTVGIERATPTLLERMLKSTIGFSDIVEKNNYSQIIQQKYDFFVKNSMLSDCYFYLGYLNQENFVKIKDSLNREQDLMHILKVAFDVEADSNLLEQQSTQVQKSCNDILGILSSA